MKIMKKTEENDRSIACESCVAKGIGNPTMLEAWISDELLKQLGESSIQFIDDESLRLHARNYPKDCAIEGHCYPCDGPDDGDDGNQD